MRRFNDKNSSILEAVAGSEEYDEMTRNNLYKVLWTPMPFIN